MNKPALARRWFQGWRSAPVPAEQDPADYGTAFGLDLSLPELRSEPRWSRHVPAGCNAWQAVAGRPDRPVDSATDQFSSCFARPRMA